MTYNPNFLGEDTPLPLPTLSPAVIGNVLSDRLQLRDGIYADYVNYSFVKNRLLRSPLYAALNIDQNQLKDSRRKRGWDFDTRVGGEFQRNSYF